jgi:ribonuclease R
MNIDREAVLKALRQAPPQGVKIHELAVLTTADAKGKHRLPPLLAQLIEDGTVEKAPGMRYRLVGYAPPAPAASVKKGQVTGRLRVHPAGYGFVIRDDGEDDIYVGAKNRGHAMDGDRVALSTWLGHKGTEGKVEDVLERGRARLTGTIRGRGMHAHLEPDDPRIVATSGHVALPEGTGGARDGQAVVVEISKYPERPDEPLQGRVFRTLGDPDDPATEIEKIVITSDIPDEFPEEVKQAGHDAPGVVRAEDLVDRVDLRDRAFVTIDPETARDFDDAVCVEASPKANHTRLWVAVADVSHYVRVGSPLDKEARIRGCSVYLPNRAIPMLPHELSSGICSLNPDVDRLAMVARMEIDANGGVSDPYFCAAVIRSKARMDYAGVAAALAGDLRGPRARYREWVPYLQQMKELAARIRALRTARGALDFELPEAKVVLDEDDPKRVRDVVQSRANPEVKGAYQIVEDFMLAANEAVARHFRERNIDTLWRVHDVPADERLEMLAQIAEAYGLKFDPEEGRSPKKLRDFLFKLDSHAPGVKRALNFMTLRALKQAVYDTVNVGHFGLAAPDYVHFTSPIRRYPDLIVHRLLKFALHADGLAAGGPPQKPPAREVLTQMAVESSKNERRAMEAEREVVDLYRAFLMREHVGEEYEGVVAGIASFGLFVQIESPFFEGLIKLDTLSDDFYQYDERTMRMTGSRSGRSFALGDQVRVVIENVSVQQRKIDLALLEHTATVAPAPARNLKKKRQEHREKERRADRLQRGRKHKPTHRR